MREHERILILCQSALSESPKPKNTEHAAVLKLLPQGVYEHYEGEHHFVLGIERGEQVKHPRKGFYTVRTVLANKNGCTEVRIHSLFGIGPAAEAAWFYPVVKEGKIARRFNLLRRITFSALISARLAK